MNTVTLNSGLQFIVKEEVTDVVEPDNYVEDVNSFCYIAINHKRQ